MQHFNAQTNDIATYAQDLYPKVFRCIAFIDVAGFTAFTHTNGTHAAAQMLNVFRNNVRAMTGMHGVRVAKWLGDGVMIVGITEEPVVECLRELFHASTERGIPVHGGVTSGEILIFEGDDYIGRVVNTASRLADHAQAGELLISGLSAASMQALAMYAHHVESIDLKGIGQVTDVVRVRIT